MLAYNNDSHLKEKKVKDIAIFFCQIWQELTDSRTLDTYQYKVLNCYYALNELQEVIHKTVENIYPTEHNMKACIEETKAIIACDQILQKYEKALLDSLNIAFKGDFKKSADMIRLRFQISCAIKKLKPEYLSLLLDELKNSIIDNNFADIEAYAKNVVSQCINNGWSAKALRNMMYFFMNENEFEDQWENFTKRLFSDKTAHTVFISIQLRPKKTEGQISSLRTLESLGLVTRTYNEAIAEYHDNSELSKHLNSKKKYFLVSVEAPDFFSSAHLALKQISEKIVTASFFNLVSAWDLKSVTITSIRQETGKMITIAAEELYETHDYLDSSGLIFENTRKIFNDGKNDNLRSRLQGSFAYANISRASLFQEEKYMNLWVALESLARTQMYDNIFSNIKETLPEALCLRYIYRIVRNFIEDCGRCDVDFSFSKLTVNIKQQNKQELVKEVIQVLNDPVSFSELETKCKVNSLLFSRAHSIQILVSDASYARAKLEKHYKMVAWQIQRLYRYRNEIAHSALQKNSSLIIYIEHLYDYLSIYISEIVTCIEKNNLESIEEALCIIKSNYDVFISLANNRDYTTIQSRVLSSGIIDLVT